MLLNPIYYLANKTGIPRVQSNKVTVTTTEVEFTFDANNIFNSSYSGLVLVKIDQTIPTDTTTTLPIVFNSAGSSVQAVTTYGKDAVTVSTFGGTGIYLMYYDKSTSTLQALTGIN